MGRIGYGILGEVSSGETLTRRSLLSALSALIPASLLGQKAIMEKGQAVVCAENSIQCPNGHATCKVINAPLEVGNDNRNYPESSQLFDYHVLRCDQCHVLFTRE